MSRMGVKRSKPSREKSYDLILLDWQMPDLDGLQATRIIRAQEAAVVEREASTESQETEKNDRSTSTRAYYWCDRECHERGS